MLPSAGWLAEDVIYQDKPLSYPLPVEFQATYTEGSDGTMDIASGAYWKGDLRYVDCGVKLSEGYGPDGSTPVLQITLRQPNVFGVLLLDWFDPPGEGRQEAFFPMNENEDQNPLQDSSVAASGATPVSGGAATAYDSSDGATTPVWS